MSVPAGWGLGVGSWEFGVGSWALGFPRTPNSQPRTPVSFRRAAVVAATCLLLASCARFSSHRDSTPALTITNFTGRTIHALYLSPSDAPTWQENVLGQDVLKDGAAVVVRLPAGGPRRWDLRVQSREFHADWRQLDCTRIAAVSLRMGRGIAIAEASARR
jgi:hypothetical protein